MLTPRAAFKVGFLGRCAAAGMTADEIVPVVKAALDKLALLDQAVDLAKGVGSTILNLGIPAALAIPPIVGGLAGYGLQRATDYKDTDIKDIKDTEVLDSYKLHTEQLKRQKAIRDYQRARRQSGRVFV